MKKLFNDFILYLKYREEINENYEYAVEDGYQQDETYNWRQKLYYWKDCQSFDLDDAYNDAREYQKELEEARGEG